MVLCPNCNCENEAVNNYCEYCMEDLRFVEEKSTEELLITVATEEEALVLEGLLKSAGIYSSRRYCKIGEYLKISTGSSSLGINLYVSKHDYEFAHQLINSEPVDFDYGDEELDEGDLDVSQIEGKQQVPSISGTMPLLIFIFILILYLLMYR